ncbi:hypothetical protein SFC88_05970 [Nocardioides sp. HM23]|uniref:hypothetical protein n=1 Tax=Nocardioides bizhenqiangii TaxID=3095076 RepID=UPI002ACAE9BA|nr:hypothetical protein [Nocardioides sp. HM23]MDZ5620358.1 hypothetical protein [Nocardioides sp. HM23]
MTALVDPAATRPRAVDTAPWAAAVWAVVFLALSSLALVERTPHPWSPEEASPLGALSAEQMSWTLAVTAALVLGGQGIACLARTPVTVRIAGWALVGLGTVVAVAISDVRALAFLGYLPMTLLALIGVGPAAGHVDAGLFVDSAAAVGHAVGGVAIAVTGYVALARARSLDGGGRTRRKRWVRWGPSAVAVSVVVPLLYAVTRIAWALDIPLGIRRSMLDDLGSGRYAGLGLALFAVAGAWLTSGLQARWGEVFWSWLPRVGGRPVPLALALVPGLFVAGAVLSAGLSFWRLVLVGGLAEVPGARSDWAAWAPELLWPVWGVALALACLAYLERRTT